MFWLGVIGGLILSLYIEIIIELIVKNKNI